jgi:hypothetical protein
MDVTPVRDKRPVAPQLVLTLRRDRLTADACAAVCFVSHGASERNTNVTAASYKTI